MDYYERIDKAITYIEHNLTCHLQLKDVASTAYMSLSNFYRLFFALTGYKVKEYIRYRRMARAAEDLISTKATIMELAIKYDFTSSDTFSRAFNQIVGCLPSHYRHNQQKYLFERIDLMEEYYDLTHDNLINEYPEIRVLKKIDPMTVAYFESYDPTPEYHAFKSLLEWANKANLLGDQQYRLFGFDIYNESTDLQGYAACMTIDSDLKITDRRVRTRDLEGGLYAVTTVHVKAIASAWKRFKHWVKLSKYEIGTHQHLEEHLQGVDLSFDYEVQLMMPIVERPIYEIVNLPPSTVVMSKVYGNEDVAPYEAWNHVVAWSKENSAATTPNYYAYNNYSIKRANLRKYYIAMVTCKEQPKKLSKNLTFHHLDGGKFLSTSCSFDTLPHTWERLVKYMNISGIKINPKLKWREEWHLKDFSFDNPHITLYCPIK